MSAEPAYQRIADDLRRKIESGEYAPGDLLPSQTDLMEDYGVGRTVIWHAFLLLKGAGLVEGRQGKGTFVVDRPQGTDERQDPSS